MYDFTPSKGLNYWFIQNTVHHHARSPSPRYSRDLKIENYKIAQRILNQRGSLDLRKHAKEYDKLHKKTKTKRKLVFDAQGMLPPIKSHVSRNALSMDPANRDFNTNQG